MARPAAHRSEDAAYGATSFSMRTLEQREDPVEWRWRAGRTSTAVATSAGRQSLDRSRPQEADWTPAHGPTVNSQGGAKVAA